jgi:hypothetical protein
MNTNRKEELMKLTPPKQVTFYIAVLIFIAGILVKLLAGAALASYGIWIIAIAFLLLAIANTTKGL